MWSRTGNRPGYCLAIAVFREVTEIGSVLSIAAYAPKFKFIQNLNRTVWFDNYLFDIYKIYERIHYKNRFYIPKFFSLYIRLCRNKQNVIQIFIKVKPIYKINIHLRRIQINFTNIFFN